MWYDEEEGENDKTWEKYTIQPQGHVLRDLDWWLGLGWAGLGWAWAGIIGLTDHECEEFTGDSFSTRKDFENKTTPLKVRG